MLYNSAAVRAKLYLLTMVFRYGAELVYEGEIDGGDIIIVFCSVMLGTSFIAQAGPNFEALMTARGAAFAVFDICARVSCLYFQLATGMLSHEISLKDCFHYCFNVNISLINKFQIIYEREINL